TVNVFSGTNSLGTVVADSDGKWSLTPTLAEGPHAITVTAIDPAGNPSAQSPAFDLRVDTIAPTGANITRISSDTGIPGDWITADVTPTLSGTLNSALGTGEVVQASLDGGTTWTAVTASNTTWSWTPPGAQARNHTLSVRVMDAAGNVSDTTAQTFRIDRTVAPVASMSQTGGLFGIDFLVSGGLLPLPILNFRTQQIYTVQDANHDLKQVELKYSMGLGFNIGLPTFTVDQTMAAELGLSAVGNSSSFFVVGESNLVVRSLDGGPIDNLKINELLGSVGMTGAGINLSFGVTTTINATDMTGLPGTDFRSTFVGVDLLSAFRETALAIQSGTSGNDLINGTANDDRMYGYAGDDVINAGNGNDLLRGGAGSDILRGGNGVDILIGGAGNDRLTGDAGSDVFRWEVQGSDATGGNGRDTITDFTVSTTGTSKDNLDLARLLIGYFTDADGPVHTVSGVARIDAGDTIRDYLRVTNAGADTVISIDRDGLGTRYASETLVTLTNVTTDLETLLANQQLAVVI
ncbi:Ca2+-binding RTX toxin-like protein, partial [Variovorax boronicumulans]|uniref:Ig-like domain-containing protein n=1 Tax=Variovorax boronicumulans TaxID=436515 RepID=UPI00277D90F8